MKILAPRNVGYKAEKLRYYSYWNVRPNQPSIRASAAPTVLASYKSPLVKSDGKRPTDYSRMIGKVVPEQSCDAYNNTYVIQSETWAGSLAALPYGCDYKNGTVSVPQWMVNKVVLDALEDAQQLDANVLEDLAQLRLTGSMIADLHKSIGKLFLLAVNGKWGALRRRFIGNGVTIPRNVANGWLMYFYGIKPLISTIEALAMFSRPMYRNLKIRKRVSENVSAETFISSNTPAGALRYSGKAVQQCQCQLNARIKLEGNLHTWQKLGITQNPLTDLVVTSWALVPYSFVVDWFIPVENWLRTLVWSPFLEYQGGFIGRRYEVNGSFTQTKPWDGQWPYSGILPKYRLQVKFYQRTFYPYVVPQTTLSIRMTLSSTQIFSAAALLTSRR